jgi:hypothetical protein
MKEQLKAGKQQLKAGKKAVKKQLKAGKKAVKEQLKEVTRRRSSTDAVQGVVGASIVGWTFCDDEKGKFVEFSLEVRRSSLASRLRGAEDTVLSVFARYSDFVKLREGLVSLFDPDDIDDDIVAPIDRRHLRKFGQRMLEERAAKLNTFLQAVVEVKEQRESEPFSTFLMLTRDAMPEKDELSARADAAPVPASTLLGSVRDALDRAMDVPAPSKAALREDSQGDVDVVSLDKAEEKEELEEEKDSDEENEDNDGPEMKKFLWQKGKGKGRGGNTGGGGGGGRRGERRVERRGASSSLRTG